MATQMVARGYALNGDSDNAHRALDDAQKLITRAASRQEDEPAWMYFYGDTWLTAQRGMMKTELSEHGKTDPGVAITLLEKALADLPESYRRDRAWYGTMLARAHAAAENYDAAAGTGLTFAADAMAVNRYAITELEQLAATVGRKGVREARDLSDALASR